MHAIRLKELQPALGEMQRQFGIILLAPGIGIKIVKKNNSLVESGKKGHQDDILLRIVLNRNNYCMKKFLGILVIGLCGITRCNTRCFRDKSRFELV